MNVEDHKEQLNLIEEIVKEYGILSLIWKKIS